MTLERLSIDDDSWQLHNADHIARYEYAAQFAPDQRILDCGCGPGYGAAILKSAGARQVTGIDIDDATIEGARKNFKAEGIEFRLDNAETLLTFEDRSLDLVVSFENIEHLIQPLQFVQNAWRVLAPGGMLLVSTPDRTITPSFVNGRPANQHHHNEWYRHEFVSILESKFTDIRVLGQVRSYAARELHTASRFLTQLGTEFYNLTHNPIFRGIRWLGRQFGYEHLPINMPPTLAFQTLEQGAIGDYRIVPVELIPVYGEPHCHFAICKKESARTA